MSQFLDYDPISGISNWWDYNEETGKATITRTQDVQPIVDINKELANTGAKDGGIKHSWWHYATIPAIYQVKMRQAGINLNDPAATKRIIQWINEHAPALKVTAKTHGGTAPKIYLPPTNE